MEFRFFDQNFTPIANPLIDTLSIGYTNSFYPFGFELTMAPPNAAFAELKVTRLEDGCDPIPVQDLTICRQTNVDGLSDLSLNLTTSSINPQIYTPTSATLTVTNTGTVPATDLRIRDAVPTGFVREGGNEYGIPTAGFTTPQGWEIPELAPGDSASLTINYFTLTADSTAAYAEVVYAFPNDIDSTPGNGDGITADEDDEAVVIFNATGSGPGNMSLQMPRATTARNRLTNLYPNPTAQGFVVVRAEVVEDGLQTVELYDALGVIVQTILFDLAAGSHELTLELPHLPAGMYGLRLRGQSHIAPTLRLVLLR